MKQNKKIRDTPVFIIPKGYNIDNFLDFDDSGFDHNEPSFIEEVIIQYER